MKITLSTTRTHVICSVNDGPATEIPNDEARYAFEIWSKRYDRALTNESSLDLRAIGRMIFNWLKRFGAGSALISPEALTLEIRVDGTRGLNDPTDGALLDAPWELLVSPNGYFAANEQRLFVVTRRSGNADAMALPPEHGTLSPLFVTADPRGVEENNFEIQESLIRDAGSAGAIRLSVEEGGKLADFARRIKTDGPFDAFHFDCHGDLDFAAGPVLSLENEDGGVDLVGLEKIKTPLGEYGRVSLVFVDACDSDRRGKREDGGRLASFTHMLGGVGVANVVGWHGSVGNPDSYTFSKVFYGHLTKGETVPCAVARARAELLRSSPNSDWHMARLHLGPQGGGALVDPNKPKLAFANAGWEEAFRRQGNDAWPIDVPSAFVGRRKPLNAALKALRGDAPGVLIHGMAGMGKTFLARRIASRMTGHKTVVVDKFDAKHIFDGVVAAWSPTHVIADHQKWSDALAGKPGLLGQALEELLAGPLAKPPILLVLEGLERIVDVPTASSAVPAIRQEYRAALIGVLSAFAKAKSGSRLILTSRYRFVLPDDKGTDLAAQLSCVPLCPMTEGERQKQRHAAKVGLPTLDPDSTQMKSLDGEAGGHPGLQATLMATNAGINFAQVNSNAIEKAKWIAKVNAFAGERGLTVLLDALTRSQRMMLAVVGIFSPGLAIPRRVVEQVGLAAGIQKPAAELDRLLDLGLVVDFGAEVGVARVGASGMVNLLLVPAKLEDVARWSEVALNPLWDEWTQAGCPLPQDERAVELCRLVRAVQSPSPQVLHILDQAAVAATNFLKGPDNDTRLAYERVLKFAFEKLRSPSVALLHVACQCAGVLKVEPFWGDVVSLFGKAAIEIADKAIASLLQARRACHLLRCHHDKGDAKEAKKYYKEALTAYEEAKTCFMATGNHKQELADVLGEFADFQLEYADWKKALYIRIEQLNLYEALGDKPSKAVIAATIADLLEEKQEFKDALRYRDMELEILKSEGDTVGETESWEMKARTLIVWRRELEAIPVLRQLRQLYRRVADAPREVEVLLKIAKIYRALNQQDKALNIYEGDVLPLVSENPDQKPLRDAVVGMVFGLKGTRADRVAGLAKATERMEKAKALGDDAGYCFYARIVAEIGFMEDMVVSKDDLAKVNNVLREAFERAQMTDNVLEIREVCPLYGKALFALGKKDDAEEVFGIGIRRCTDSGDTVGARWLETKQTEALLNS
jgi:tetratricopeptide (TPR) repeat protein